MNPEPPPGFVGILMLDTRFPRPAGDVGNPETYRRAGIPVRFVTVPGASPQRIVKDADLARAQQDVVSAALHLVRRHPEVREIVLECTNMPPYRDAVARATGRPVHDIETLLLAAWAGLVPGTQGSA